VAALDHFVAQPSVVEFSEGGETVPLVEKFKAMLSALPASVQFGETATKARAATQEDTTPSFAAPDGYEVDPASLDLHGKAQAHVRTHGGSYLDAVKAIEAL
jgi:hypothetical protein